MLLIRFFQPRMNRDWLGFRRTMSSTNASRASCIWSNNSRGFAELMAARVFGPTMPSTVTLRMRCTCLMDVFVPDAHAQSTTIFAMDWFCNLVCTPRIPVAGFEDCEPLFVGNRLELFNRGIFAVELPEGADGDSFVGCPPRSSGSFTNPPSSEE